MRGPWRDDNSKDSICIFLFAWFETSEDDAAHLNSKWNQKLPMFDSNSYFWSPKHITCGKTEYILSFSFPSWWQWVCTSAILELTSNKPAKENRVPFKRSGQKGFTKAATIDRNLKNALDFSILIVFSLLHFPRKKSVCQSPNSPLSALSKLSLLFQQSNLPQY